MLTREEIAEIVQYCKENGVTYKRPKQEGDNAGEFLQLVPGGSFLPNPIKPSRSRSSKQKDSSQGAVAVSIELRTPTGTMMRISGNLTGRELKDIIIASSTHV